MLQLINNAFSGEKMRKIKRREKKPRKIKRRQIKVERLLSQGKCKKCGNLFSYSFEGENKKQIETKPVRAKRFKKLRDSELCLKCLTNESQSIRAYEIMQFWVFKGKGEINFEVSS